MSRLPASRSRSNSSFGGSFPPELYEWDGRGRKRCVDKAVTKQTLGRSPDNADGMLLAYCKVDAARDSVAGYVEVPTR